LAGAGRFGSGRASSSSSKNQRDKSAQRRKNGGDHRGITREKVKSVEEMSTPRMPVIYEVVRRRGKALFALISYAQVMQEL
jgi:hypothetical protein